jgi:hypothetical protein
VDGFVSATDSDYDVVRRALDLTVPVRWKLLSG